MVETTGDPVALQLIPDRSSLAGDGRDAEPITVQAVDAQGRAVPVAQNLIRFELVGPGSIIGVGNGNPLCHEPEKWVPELNDGAGDAGGWQRSLYNGLAQVIIQTDRDSQGVLRLKATAEGLKPAEIAVRVEATP